MSSVRQILQHSLAKPAKLQEAVAHFAFLSRRGWLTSSKLADCVQQLKLPALGDFSYLLRQLPPRRLQVEFQTIAIHVAITFKHSKLMLLQ